MEFLLGGGERVAEGVDAEGEEAGEEAGEVFHCVGGELEGAGGVGYVEEAAVGGDEHEVGDDEVGGFDVWCGQEVRSELLGVVSRWGDEREDGTYRCRGLACLCGR